MPRRSGTSCRPRDDPFVAQELVETLYHVLWELVHVFFDHRGLLEGRAAGTVHDTGASSFLYPFLAEREHDLEAVRRRRAPLGADEGGGGRRSCARQTLTEGGGDAVAAAAAGLRAALRGGRQAAGARQRRVGDRRDGRRGRLPLAARAPWPARPAIDLTEDPAILTAIANDIGVEAIFARQVIAYGQRGRRAARALHQRQLART